MQALATLAVPGELEEWRDPAESVEDDRTIMADYAPLRRAAAEAAERPDRRSR